MITLTSTYKLFAKPLFTLENKKLLITTLNAHSYNVAQNDSEFSTALISSDVLIPDGIGIILAKRWLTGEHLQKIAGADLFFYEMERVNALGGNCFFLGSNEDTLDKIKKRATMEYPNIQIFSYSPPYKSEFTVDENTVMRIAINIVAPDVLFIGMTAPKQEKWAHAHFNQLHVGHVCCVGAVFDFYAGTVNRAPQWMIQIGMEWFYRLFKEPRRMWRRYLIGNVKFVGYVLREKFSR